MVEYATHVNILYVIAIPSIKFILSICRKNMNNLPIGNIK